MTPFFGQRLEVAFWLPLPSLLLQFLLTWQTVIVNQIHDSDIMTVGKKSMEQKRARKAISPGAFNRVLSCSDAQNSGKK
jgi:hypothetical protein